MPDMNILSQQVEGQVIKPHGILALESSRIALPWDWHISLLINMSMTRASNRYTATAHVPLGRDDTLLYISDRNETLLPTWCYP